MTMLRTLRERKALTVSQLAAKAGISSRVILDYEEGRQNISLAHAKLLAKALWVGIEELMPPAGSMPPQPIAASPGSHPAPPSTPMSSASSAPVMRPQMASAVAAPPTYRASNAAAPSSAAVLPRQDLPRARPAGGDSHGSGHHGSSPQAGGKPARSPRPAPPPPGPISEGQLEELRRLAVKLEITQEQLEERVGKKLEELNRPEAKDWIKRVRGMAEELAPSRKAPYGTWPDSREDQEAAYLKSQQDAGAYFLFKLFDGEQFSGVISDFTPYTITIKEQGSGDETVLRKLAIAYYRHVEPPKEKTAAKSTRSKARSQSAEEQHQPLDDGVDSDRTGEPAKPERDNMDEDRGV